MTIAKLVKPVKVNNVTTSIKEFSKGDSFTLKGDGTSETAQFTLNNSANTFGTTIKSAEVISNITFTLPDNYGANGQLLRTDGNGNLTFVNDENATVLTDDSSPQLVADLDVNGNSIVSNLIENIGTPEHFSALTAWNAATFDSSQNKVVIFYRNPALGLYHGTAVVGTVDGTSITFGTPVVFNGANTLNIQSAFDSNSNKVVIAYRDAGNSNYGTAVVGTVDGTGITFGTPVVFESSITYVADMTFDSNSNKVVIVWGGKTIVGTVDGTSITFGTSVTYSSGGSGEAITFDSNSNKVVIGYEDSTSGYGTAVVGTVSGTSITFGTPAVYENGGINYNSATFDSNSNKVVFAYLDSSNTGSAIVGNVSGTSISFGTPVVFNSGYTIWNAPVFDTFSNQVIIAYSDLSNSSIGTLVVGTVSGTSISLGTPVVFNNANSTNIRSVFDTSQNKVVIAYKDGGNNDYVTGIVYSPPNSDVSLLPEGTGKVLIDGDGTASGITLESGSIDVKNSGAVSNMKFYDENNSNYIQLQSASHSSYSGNVTSTLPTTSDSLITSESVVLETATKDFVATGAISTGNVVGLKSDGTVEAINGDIPAFGPSSSSGGNSTIAATFDTNLNKFVVVWQGGSLEGTAIVGTVSETTITFGTPVIWDTGNFIRDPAVTFDSNLNKIVIAYQDRNNSDYGMAVVGTIVPGASASQDSITFGAPVAFESSAVADAGAPTNTGKDIAIAFDDNLNKVMIVYKHYNNNLYGTAKPGTIVPGASASQDSITFGTSTVFWSQHVMDLAIGFNSYRNKFAVGFATYSYGGYGRIAPATIVAGASASQDSITFGQFTIFNYDTQNNYTVTHDISIAMGGSGAPTYSRFAIVWQGAYDYSTLTGGDHGAATMGSLWNGASLSQDYITVGTRKIFNAAVTHHPTAVYNPSKNEFLVAYRDNGSSGQAYAKVATWSGSSIYFNDPAILFNGGSNNYSNVPLYDPSESKVVIPFDSSAKVYYYDTNAASWIGIATENIADGATGEIALMGTIVDRVGVTPGVPYYVRFDGALTATENAGPLQGTYGKIGKAISTTQLLITEGND